MGIFMRQKSRRLPAVGGDALIAPAVERRGLLFFSADTERADEGIGPYKRFFDGLKRMSTGHPHLIIRAPRPTKKKNPIR